MSKFLILQCCRYKAHSGFQCVCGDRTHSDIHISSALCLFWNLFTSRPGFICVPVQIWERFVAAIQWVHLHWSLAVSRTEKSSGSLRFSSPAHPAPLTCLNSSHFPHMSLSSTDYTQFRSWMSSRSRARGGRLNLWVWGRECQQRRTIFIPQTSKIKT